MTKDLTEVLADIERRGSCDVDDTNMFLKINFVGERDKSVAFRAWIEANGLKVVDEYVRTGKNVTQYLRISRAFRK